MRRAWKEEYQGVAKEDTVNNATKAVSGRTE